MMGKFFIIYDSHPQAVSDQPVYLMELTHLKTGFFDDLGPDFVTISGDLGWKKLWPGPSGLESVREP